MKLEKRVSVTFMSIVSHTQKSPKTEKLPNVLVNSNAHEICMPFAASLHEKSEFVWLFPFLQFLPEVVKLTIKIFFCP